MKRSYGIDLIRTLSILIVILRHYEVLITGFNYGVYAIEFLFVISGFLIGQILIKEFYHTNQITTDSVKHFMMRRWFRILPLYYLAIFLKFIFYPEVGKNIIFYLFFLQNNFYGISFFPETWSLVIDEWFYLGTPILLYLFMKFVNSKPFHVLLFLIATIVVINGLRCFWVYKTNIIWDGINGNIVLHQDTLLIGVVVAFIKRHYQNLFQRMNTKIWFYSGLTAFIVYIFIIRAIRYPEDMVNHYFITRTFAFTICSVIIACMLPYLENSIRPINFKPLNFLNTGVIVGSKISYALYLFHSMALALSVYCFDTLFKEEWIKAIGFIFSIVISYLLYQYVEKKFLIIRDRYYPERTH